VPRNFLATAAALLAAGTLFTSAAEACISCEYVPEVVRSSSTLPHTGHYYAAERYTKKAARVAVEPRKRIVRSEPVAKKLNTAKADRSDKVERAEAKVEKAEKAEKKIAKVEPTETKKVAESENSSISLASNDTAAVKDAVAKATKEVSAKPTDCKKFFASVGMTLTVPCE
jgi:glutamyl/glutaminyl-tRNA synthetase